MLSGRALLVTLLGGVSVLACGTDSSTSLVADGGSSVGGSRGGGPSVGGSAARGGAAGTGARAPGNGGTGAGGHSSGVRDASSDGQASPDASTGLLLDCEPDSATISSAADPSVRRRVRGSNGTFVDYCDTSGNLVKFACEQLVQCGPGPNPACTSSYSGLVSAAIVDCADHCRDGSCEDRCPSPGQTIIYESTDGAGYFVARNETDGERYQCTVVFDNDRDSFDCIEDARTGDEARIDGSSNGTCEAGFPLAVVVKGSDASPGAAQCTLTCRRKTGDIAAPASGAPAATACPAAGQVAPGPFVGTPGARSALTGTNGRFEDRCTTDGNLVDYGCDITNASTGPPWHVYSGLVAASYYDCGGGCQAGACIASCPTAGQALAFESAVVDGYLRVRNVAEGRHYGCVVTWDDPGDSFDCATGIRSGNTGAIVTSVGSGDQCTAQFADIAVVVDGATSSCSGCSECKLACRVIP